MTIPTRDEALGGRQSFRLSDLVDGLETDAVIGDLAVPVTGLAYYSKAVRPGYAFFCVRGFKVDGHSFIPEAIERGAAVLVVEGREGLEAARPLVGAELAAGKGAEGTAPVVVVVPDTRAAMGRAAANFYDHPSRRLRVVGVTGTNGKTTTSHLVREILVAAGASCGLIGTVHNVVGGKSLPAGRTTPEAIDLQDLADKMVFTNLTQDHLDFHGDLESYFQAKARLFRELGTSYLGRPKTGVKAAVLNADDAASSRLASLARVPAATYAVAAASAGVRASSVRLEPARSTFTLRVAEGLGVGLEGIPAFEGEVSLSLTGAYNVSNALAALTVALVEGVPPQEAAAALTGIRGAPGRFELVECGQPFMAVVDYAHTPDGLENVLRAARALEPARVITVFGCGGDRDRTKRPLMGEVAARYSDFCVLTSDNPRSEDPPAIIEDILPGLDRLGRREGTDFVREPDRRRAIELAVRRAEAGDLVLVAGKGHETYQTFADRTIHFDDREVLREAIAELGGSGGDG